MANKIPEIDIRDIPEVEDELAVKLEKKWKDGLASHQQRTKGFEFFARVAHNLSLFEKGKDDTFSEGSTQAIKRKIRAQTLQRVPDGEIVTPFDKNSIEQVVIDFLFKHKILTSEYDGKDMMKQLWKTFNAAYDYGFGCVRTGFERDLDGDPRVSYTLIPYNDVIPSPDCKCIEEADWYIIREYIPHTTLKELLDPDTGTVSDTTYDADVVRYIVETEAKDGSEPYSMPLADRKKAKTNDHSIEVRTYYCRGADEFISYVPSLKRILRRVKNYDPRKDVPIHFLILEPDPEFPYGCSSVMWTIAQQQYADAFQSVSYQTLLLALRPPLMTFGNLTNPKLKMKPGAIWPMGTNPNNRIEPFRVETTTVTQYGSILENISAKMMQSLNITDATVASDANVPGYSATPQGVEQQKLDKTITINQFQKRIETFFAEWANHALRSYINSMSGEHEITIDYKTRKRIEDIEKAIEDNKLLMMQQAAAAGMSPDMLDIKPGESIIDGNKITVDFDTLSEDCLFQFEVRAGSLIENERDTERANIQEMLIPVSQMIGNISEGNRDAFESVIMQLVARLCELSDIDISATLAGTVNEKLIMSALQSTMDMVANQQDQIGQLQQQVGMPPEMQPGMAGEQPVPPEMAGAAPAMPVPPEESGQYVPPAEQLPPEMGQQVPGMPADVMPQLGEEMPPEQEIMV